MATATKATPRLRGWAGRIQTGVEAQGMTIVRTGRDSFRVLRANGSLFCEGSAEKVHAATYDTPFMRAAGK